MKISSGYTYHFDLKPGRTFLLTILLFIILLGTCETILHSAWFQSRYPVPYPVGGYKSVEDSFRSLDSFIRETGSADCIILGSSLATVGINPIIFEHHYQAQSGQPVKCFNFGVSAGTASSFGPLAAILVHNYHPQLIIVADRSRAFSEISNEQEAKFPETPWAQYHQGQMNFQGWFEDHFFAYRYLEVVFPQFISNKWQSTEWKDPNQAGRPNMVNAYSVQGYSPLVTYLDGAAIYWVKEGIPYQKRTITRPFILSDNDLKGMDQMINLDKQGKVRIIFVELPSPDSFFIDSTGAPQPTEQGVYRTTIANRARKNGVPFWTTSELDLVPAIEFADGKHLYIRGSYDFSTWLGIQIGEAVRRGLMGTIIPTDLVDKPPLETVQSIQDYLKPRGMSPEIYKLYDAHRATFNLTPTDSIIFNPHPVHLETESLQTILGFFIQWCETVNDQKRTDLFDLMVLQDKMRYQEDLQLKPGQKDAVDQWRTSQLPGFLKAVGIDYLLYTEQWDNPNSAPRDELKNGEYYRKIKTWEYPPLRETYTLYQVIGKHE